MKTGMPYFAGPLPGKSSLAMRRGAPLNLQLPPPVATDHESPTVAAVDNTSFKFTSLPGTPTSAGALIQLKARKNTDKGLPDPMENLSVAESSQRSLAIASPLSASAQKVPTPLINCKPPNMSIGYFHPSFFQSPQQSTNLDNRASALLPEQPLVSPPGSWSIKSGHGTHTPEKYPTPQASPHIMPEATDVPQLASSRNVVNPDPAEGAIDARARALTHELRSVQEAADDLRAYSSETWRPLSDEEVKNRTTFHVWSRLDHSTKGADDVAKTIHAVHPTLNTPCVEGRA